jgi:hypothetical protein
MLNRRIVGLLAVLLALGAVSAVRHAACRTKRRDLGDHLSFRTAMQAAQDQPERSRYSRGRRT